MTIQQLESYRDNVVELETITEQLKECEVVTGVQSASEFPYALHTVTQSGLPSTPRVTELLKRQSDLEAACESVLKFVYDIDDDKMRSMIRLKYLTIKRKVSWQEVAMKHGYLDEGTPRKKIRQYLQDKE